MTTLARAALLERPLARLRRAFTTWGATLHGLARVRGLLGLMTLGEGLIITFRIVPHESWLLGALLVALGSALLWRAQLPQIARIPLPARVLIATLGALIAMGVLAYDALLDTPLDPPKVAIILLGATTAIAAPFATRKLTPGTHIGSVLLWSVPVAWAPLGVWALQGATKTALGATPLELFIHAGLLVPMSFALTLLGRSPQVVGQIITYDTPHGPFSLQVGVACSGLQAMAMFTGILAIYLLVVRPTWKTGLAWCTAGIIGLHLTNVARLIVLALVGSAWGTDALQTAHANAGWLFFVAWTALFAWLAMGRADTPKAADPTR